MWLSSCGTTTSDTFTEALLLWQEHISAGAWEKMEMFMYLCIARVPVEKGGEVFYQVKCLKMSEH